MPIASTTSPPLALFDDNLAGGRHLWLTGLRERLECRDPAAVPDYFARVEAARAAGHWVALAAHYELGYCLEPRLRPLLPDGHPVLLRAWAWEQGEWLSQGDGLARLDAALAGLDEHARLAGVAGLTHGIQREAYLAACARVQALIQAGDCYQVNLTWPLRGVTHGAPLALYRRLMAAQPVRHGAFIADPEGAILSRSPELFVERRGTRLRCQPMKGTAPRALPAARLRESAKDRAENLMIVDLIRNDLGRLAPPGGVWVENLFHVEAYPTLWQMTSTVMAEPVTADLLTVFRALFPCGSVTGAPRIRAMEIIRELEGRPRGLYCGALGWLAPDGDFRFSVPIRTLRLAPDGTFSLPVGSGLVADSDGPGEWGECLLKGRFLSALAPPFGLIETLRREAGRAEPYPLLEGHLRRLTASARYFGHPCDPAAVRQALLEHAGRLPDGPHRVRLELSPDGGLQLTSQPLEAPPPDPWVMLARERVHSGDPLLRHKTTARERYDRVLREALGRGCFDALFLNERGLLAEGARSTLFLDPGDGRLLTPPLSAGCLDGVLRRQLLDQGRALERDLTLADLERAAVLYLGNALRGLLRVRLLPSDVPP